MNVDQQQQGGNGKDEGFDDPVYRAFLEGQVPEAKDDDDVLPRGSYIVEFKGGKGSFGPPKAQEKIPQVRLSYTIAEGQDGTVGQTRFANLKVGISQYRFEDDGHGTQLRKPLTDAEKTENSEERALELLRVAAALKLLIRIPNRAVVDGKPVYTEETLTEYAKGFAGRKACVTIGISGARDGFEPSNWIKWSSIRSLDEKVVKQGTDFGTAQEYTRKKIAADNKKAATKAGRTVAAAAATTAPAAKAEDFN